MNTGFPSTCPGSSTPQVIGIRKHGHDFFSSYLILGIRQVYTVPKGFAHFSLAVYTGRTQTRLIVRQKDIRLHQGLSP